MGSEGSGQHPRALARPGAIHGLGGGSGGAQQAEAGAQPEQQRSVREAEPAAGPAAGAAGPAAGRDCTGARMVTPLAWISCASRDSFGISAIRSSATGQFPVREGDAVSPLDWELC